MTALYLASGLILVIDLIEKNNEEIFFYW
jgi:hypothetical protein